MMKNLRFAMKQIIPILPSVFFVGFAFGILMQASGYSMIWTFLSAVFIFAGSMQMVMVSLLNAGAPLSVMAAMTLIINARHIFYGVTFVEKFKRQGWKQPYLVLTLVDETYSVLCSLQCPADLNEDRVIFDISALVHMIWIISCTFGAFLGQSIPFDLKGIDFSATAFFTVVAVNQWRQFESRLPALIGFISAVFFYVALGADHFILPALSVSLLVLAVLKDPILKKMGGNINAG